MQIVIDIDELYYIGILEGISKQQDETVCTHVLYEAVKKGTPLPKGHGRLRILSEDAIKREQTSLGVFSQNWISEVGLSNATVAIIEADGGAE